MGKLHLNFSHRSNEPSRVDPDQRRADLMAGRFLDGLRTLDAKGRRQVLHAIAANFCTGCGSDNPACTCTKGGRDAG